MSANGGMKPRRVIGVILITGIIIIASVGGLFMAADSAGLITAEIWVSGYVQGSNASYCYLYMDGVKIASQSLGYDYYNDYGNKHYQFYDIDVKANAEHEFQIVTSIGECSEKIVEYIPYGERTSLSIDVVKTQVQVTVRGEYEGNNSGSTQIYLSVDEQNKGSDYVYSSSPEYSFSVMVYENSYHTFRVTAGSYYSYEYMNETTIYVGSVPMTIYMDLE